MSLDGDHYFYVNTLQLRGGSVSDNQRDPVNGRRALFGCACCPPSVLRTLSVLHTYLATSDPGGLQLHQYAAADVTAELAGGAVALRVHTDYPHDPTVRISVATTPDTAWTLSLRIPSWCPDASLTVDGEPAGGTLAAGTTASVHRTWTAGTEVVLELPIPVRLHVSDDRVDATRGSVAFTRGPLVYAFEQVDQPAGVPVDDLRITAAPTPGTALPQPEPSTGAGGGTVATATATAQPELLGGIHTITVPATVRGGTDAVDAVAVPYAVWANREVGPMRVWTPLA